METNIKSINNFTWFIAEVLYINDTVLYARVKVRAYGYYDNKEISCDNLDLNRSKNIAVAYNNVIINDNNSIIKADIGAHNNWRIIEDYMDNKLISNKKFLPDRFGLAFIK